ncbi:tRNA 2-thiocytidine biosynthesis protein TtcA [Acidaminobacter sp. JC074]|uniref:tRNA 2-thiocytidine biosynthesis TtcA family protein n=1 Tax=Acidaminobacter sp. JC074 TaxID=2530199 RepID=UPI001F0DE24E|nr:ATP-binding protein [Acidaminobacter sp. JC074]MCH4888561.1 tRNA 2-thiocytidine biosynthesis protein TtcA [Acidaminobacter sp. JC074]
MSGLSGSGCEIFIPENDLKPLKEIEKNLIKKYRKQLWSPFVKAIKKYDLIQSGDKIAVAISGGKDSLILAKLFQELQKHGLKNFDLEFMCMDPGFNEANRVQLEKNCEHLNIPIKIFDKQVFKVVDEIANDYPCYLCARMRRGALYNFAQEHGCNKIALGHHFDDTIETIMMNVLCSGQYKTMMPKLKSTNFDNMELIRPMYLIREADIKKFSSYNGLNPMDCGCIVAAKKTSSKRREVKELIEKLGETFDNVEKNIFNSANCVHTDAILGWKDDEGRHSFLDNFND